MDERRLIRTISLTAVLTAVSFVATAFLSIPYPLGGYFNFGDAVTIVASYFLGPLPGLFVGAVGGSLADVFLGAANFAPWTLVAKGLLALSVSLFSRLGKGKLPFFLLGGFIGGSLEVAIYFLSYLAYYGTVSISSLFDMVQAYGCLLVALPVTVALRKALPHIGRRSVEEGEPSKTKTGRTN